MGRGIVVATVLLCAAAGCIGVASAQAPGSAVSTAALHKLIVSDVKLQPPALIDGAQVSPLRATNGPQLGDSMLCLKTVEPIAYIAVFFEGGRVLSYRRAVAVDRCAGESYAALTLPPPARTASRQKRGPAAPRGATAAAGH